MDRANTAPTDVSFHITRLEIKTPVPDAPSLCPRMCQVWPSGIECGLSLLCVANKSNLMIFILSVFFFHRSHVDAKGKGAARKTVYSYCTCLLTKYPNCSSRTPSTSSDLGTP